MFSALILMVITSIIICIMGMLFLVQSPLSQGEKSYPLESGFWCLSGGSMKFSIQFFTLLLIFVLFDVEIILLAPMVFITIYNLILFYSLLTFIFGTLLLEWWWGKLTWFD